MKGWKEKRKHGVIEGEMGTLWVLWKDTEDADVEEAELESEEKGERSELWAESFRCRWHETSSTQ